MDARTPHKYLHRLVLLGLLMLLAIGLWQGYGAWLLEQVSAHGH